MADQKVKVILEAEDRASAKVKQAQGAFAGFGSFLKNAFTFSIRDVVSVFGLLKDAVTSAISAAAESEVAINRTANAMKAAGTFSEESLKSVTAFADTLQRTTGIGDEAGLALFALARSFTATNREAAELVTVAADFSAASGKGLEESVQAIAAAMNGATRGVAKFLPEIANLTDEQLRSGEATRLLGERFKGLAAGDLNTLTGQFGLVKNAAGELLEAFGKGLKGTNELKGALAGLNETLASETTVKGFAKLGLAIRGFFLSLGDLDKTVGTALLPVKEFLVTLDAWAASFLPAQKSTDSFSQALDLFAARAQRSDAAAQALTTTTKAQTDALAAATAAIDDEKNAAALAADQTARLAEETTRLAAETAAAAEGQKIYTAAYDAYIASMSASAESSVANISGLQQTRAALDGVAGAAQRGTAQLTAFTAAAAKAAFSSNDFDRIAGASGQGAATSAAVSGGGTLSSGGRRVSLPGGGSRLTFAPGERGPGLRYS